MTAPTVFPPRFPRRLIFPTKGKPGAPRTYPPGPWRPREMGADPSGRVHPPRDSSVGATPAVC